MRGFFVFLFIFFYSFPAISWDQHHLFTTPALEGFESRDQKIWEELSKSKITVTSAESFYEKAFGLNSNPKCSLEKIRSAVFDGIGIDYKVEYAEVAEYDISLDWERGLSWAFFHFFENPFGLNHSSIGQTATPLQIISAYSDEPDWHMDDDVPRLKDLGTTDGIRGLGTRILRHFWYENQEIADVNLGAYQEMHKRIKLFFDLSQIAFHINEPYWGFRFLANGLHYIQDLTQPFHVKAIMSTDFIQSEKVRNVLLCSIMSSDNPRKIELCSKNTLHSVLIESGWLVATFHSIYEDFGRGLIFGRRGETTNYLSDKRKVNEKYTQIPEVLFLAGSKEPNDPKVFIRSIQEQILNYSDPVAQNLSKTFGKKYKTEKEHIHTELLASGKQTSSGFLFGAGNFYDLNQLKPSEQQARRDLIATTNDIFYRLGFLSRSWTAFGLNYRNSISVRSANELRKKYADLCN